MAHYSTYIVLGKLFLNVNALKCANDNIFHGLVQYCLLPLFSVKTKHSMWILSI